VETSLETNTRLALLGHPEAMAALGCRCYEGLEVPQDFARARGWFEKAAGQGNALATVYLGYCHYYGRDLPRDLERAHQLFTWAAEMGRYQVSEAFRRSSQTRSRRGFALSDCFRTRHRLVVGGRSGWWSWISSPRWRAVSQR